MGTDHGPFGARWRSVPGLSHATRAFPGRQALPGWCVAPFIARGRLAEMIGANARIPGESHSFPADFNIAPSMLGLVLMLVAGVFQYGWRLQHDTEGLV